MFKYLVAAVIGPAALVAGLNANALALQSMSVPQGTKPAGEGSQPPPVVYKVDVTLVEVDAVVTDGRGRIIHDLTREDFQIFEDGQLQTIDRLSSIEIPIERDRERAPARPPLADVQSNTGPFDGRLYVLLLDDLHTSGSRSERVKSAARRFVEQSLEPGDLTAVIHASRPGQGGQDFSSDPNRLIASIDRFAGRALRSETLNSLDEYNRQLLFTGRPPAKISDPDEGARAHDARSVFATIAGIADRVAPVRGRRKALVWFGEGISYDMFDVVGRGQASIVLDISRTAVAAASRANLAIYGVDVRGLGGLGSEAIQLTSPAVDVTQGPGSGDLRQELLRSQENLRRTSQETGGFAVVNTDDLPRAFERIVAENSAYYLLGYVPTNDARDGTFRRIEVQVRRPGAVVRARSGYIASARTLDDHSGAPAARGAAALRAALTSPVPQQALPMAVHVAAFKGRGHLASVLVTVEYGASAFAGIDVNDGNKNRLETAVAALGSNGSVEASDNAAIELNVKPETLERMRLVGFRTHARLELPPGRFQIRAAAALDNARILGSVYQDVEVRDLSEASLAMSDLILTSVLAAYTPTAAVDDRIRDVLPAPPTTMRHFRNDEAIAVFAELYETGRPPSADVIVQAHVRNEAGEPVLEQQSVRTSGQLERSKGGCSLQISLKTLPPGRYVLRLEAASKVADSTPVAREVAFHVWQAPDRLPE